MAVVHEMAAISDVDNVIYHFDNYVVINWNYKMGKNM